MISTDDEKYKILDRSIFKELQNYSITKQNFNSFESDGDSSLFFLIKNNIEFDVEQSLRIIDLSNLSKTTNQYESALIVTLNIMLATYPYTSESPWSKPRILEHLILNSDINYITPNGISSTSLLLNYEENPQIELNNKTWKIYIDKLDTDLITPQFVSKIRVIADLSGYDISKKPILMPIESRDLTIIKSEFSKMENLISKNMFVRTNKP